MIFYWWCLWWWWWWWWDLSTWLDSNFSPVCVLTATASGPFHLNECINISTDISTIIIFVIVNMTSQPFSISRNTLFSSAVSLISYSNACTLKLQWADGQEDNNDLRDLLTMFLKFTQSRQNIIIFRIIYINPTFDKILV